MNEKKEQQPNVLEVLPDAAAAQQLALTLDQVKEALQIGRKERKEAEARVPHSTSSSRNRFR